MWIQEFHHLYIGMFTKKCTLLRISRFQASNHSTKKRCNGYSPKKQISHILWKRNNIFKCFLPREMLHPAKTNSLPSLPLKNDGRKTIFSSEMFPFQVPFVQFCEGSSMKATLSSTSSRCLTPWPPVPGYCSRSSLWPCHWQSCPKDYWKRHLLMASNTLSWHICWLLGVCWPGCVFQ